MRDDLEGLFVCVGGRWHPRIGDPHIMGWLTVGVYGLAAIAALWAGHRLRRSGLKVPQAERWFWPLLAALMLGLMVNKQLDLQSLLTAVGRCVALADGWYADRRPVQRRFIAGLAVGSGVAMVCLLLLLRRSLSRLWLAVVGVGLIGCFVLVRAVGFHGFDRFVGMRVAGWRMNWLLELGALGLLILGMLLAGIAYGRGSPRGLAQR